MENIVGDCKVGLDLLHEEVGRSSIMWFDGLCNVWIFPQDLIKPSQNITLLS